MELDVIMLRHYIDSFESSGARKGHWAILALECFTVADELGQYHHLYKRADLSKPGIKETQWKDLPSDPQDDSRLSYTSALATLGSLKLPSFWLPKAARPVFRPRVPPKSEDWVLNPESTG